MLTTVWVTSRFDVIRIVIKIVDVSGGDTRVLITMLTSLVVSVSAGSDVVSCGSVRYAVEGGATDKMVVRLVLVM